MNHLAYGKKQLIKRIGKKVDSHACKEDTVIHFSMYVVCKDKQELEAFVDQISSSTNRAEKALSKYIIEHVYPLAEKEERKKAKLEREEWKRLNPIEPVETRTYTRKRERVNYNYDNFYETDDSDEYLESSSSPPPMKKPTRSSSRLNNIE